MVGYSNISLLICQCNGMVKVTDVEKAQEIERLLIKSFNQYAYSELLKTSSEKLADKALQLMISEGIDLETLLIEIKKKVEEDGS